MLRRILGAREPEVDDACATIAREQHVRRREIEMHDALAMRGRQRRREIACDPQRVERAATALREPFAQRRPVDILHHEVRAALVIADLEDRDDVRMREARSRSRFAPQVAAARDARA